MEPTQMSSDQAPQPTAAVQQVPSQKQKVFFVSVAGLIAAAALAATGAIFWNSRNTAAASNTVEIGITSKGFGPATMHIQKGQSVTWVNTDTATHAVVSDNKTSKGDASAFGSEAMGINETYTVTFDQPGSYTYYDAMNPYTNKGRVTVN